MILVTITETTTDTTVATITPSTNATPPRADKSRTRRRTCCRNGAGGSVVPSDGRRAADELPLAGCLQPITRSATRAHPAMTAARTVMSVIDTQHDKVVAGEEPSEQHRSIWGIPLATVAFMGILTVIGAMFWPLERYSTAPGAASEVARRLVIDPEAASKAGIEIDEPDQSIRFVTALGGKLTPLEAFMGWVDPYVQVQTCEQRFGDCAPALDKQIQLGAMATAKEIAAYVAFSYLGLDARLEEGVAQVGSFDAELCPPDAPEKRACRVLDVGDTIVSVEVPGDSSAAVSGIRVVSDLSEALSKSKPGDTVVLKVRGIGMPDDEVRTVEVELMASPVEPDRTIIGFNARDTRTVVLPVAVDFDTDRIGGPSAGLAFTLALIDELSPGDLSPPGGVAATGTMAEDGTVGPIGALVQKAVAVKKSGARLFLVPAQQSEAELAAARRAVGNSVEIVTVESLTDALSVLAGRGGSPVQRG